VVLDKIRPSSIVRFLDDKWKIWDLEDAVLIGDTFVNLEDADRTAPEILKMSNTSDILITKESNIWSMGALLTELFTGISLLFEALQFIRLIRLQTLWR